MTIDKEYTSDLFVGFPNTLLMASLTLRNYGAQYRTVRSSGGIGVHLGSLNVLRDRREPKIWKEGTAYRIDENV